MATDPIRYLLERAHHHLPGLSRAEVREALSRPAVRRALSKKDPLIFATLYLKKHLISEETGVMPTLSVFHEDLIATALEWMAPSTALRAGRHAFIAPRGSGKSTWAYLILPLWAAAHGHVRFIAAFSDTATQAQGHLTTFRNELDHNELLRIDYPELCEPMVRRTGARVSDRVDRIQQRSGFAFTASGLDGSILGLKIDDQRPDLMLLDDVEPGESQYSAFLAKKRLVTIQDSVLPVNMAARVMLTGTVTMPGSIIHQLVRSVKGEGTEKWITDERFQVHYWPAILTKDDGSEESIWPQRWPLTFLTSMRHTRSFLKNFQNAPVPTESAYWTEEDIRYGQVSGITRTVLSIDPAVTAKATSDQTGLAVVGWSPSENRCLVEYAEGVRLIPGEPLRAHVLKVLAAHPHITAVVIEGNQGQAMWNTVLHDLPVKLQIVQSGKASKAERASWALQRYQQGQVLHATRLVRLEEQQIAFTGREGMADDICDAVNQAVNGFLPFAPAAQGLRMSVA